MVKKWKAIRSPLAHRLGKSFGDGLGEVFENALRAGLDVDLGGHAGLQANGVAFVAHPCVLVQGDLHAVISLFTLARVLAQGVCADVTDLAFKAAMNGVIPGIKLHHGRQAGFQVSDVGGANLGLHNQLVATGHDGQQLFARLEHGAQAGHAHVFHNAVYG